MSVVRFHGWQPGKTIEAQDWQRARADRSNRTAMATGVTAS